MTRAPGSIDLGKFRVIYEEEREPEKDGYLLQQRAVIRLNEVGAGFKPALTYTVLCDDADFREKAGKRPSPLQYFIASIGFCMFSQLARFASQSEVRIEDAEMDLRMTYDLTGKLRTRDFSSMAQGLSYVFKLKSPALVEKVIRVVQLADKGCHTVNSMRKKHLPVSGKLVLNNAEYDLDQALELRL
jgi:uncharacterized OsmC-like protein